MTEKDWESITLTDDVMFSSVFGNNPELCRKLLERLLRMPIMHVEYVNREQELVPEVAAKSIRMDVYVRDGRGTVIDVEMQSCRRGDLARRSRYYLSANDMDCIGRGEDYGQMRDSYVIFVCAFDPFHCGLPTYTCVPRFRENGREMGDGTLRLFANATAWEGCVDVSLRSFLRYLDEGIIEGDDFLSEVDGAVRALRSRPEWREQYMRFDVRLSEERAAGREERTEQVFSLYQQLAAAGRLDEFAAAMGNRAKFDSLLVEFGIVSASKDVSAAG